MALSSRLAASLQYLRICIINANFTNRYHNSPSTRSVSRAAAAAAVPPRRRSNIFKHANEACTTKAYGIVFRGTLEATGVPFHSNH